MSDEEKQPFNELALLDKIRFERQFNERAEKGYFTFEDNSRSTDLKNIHLFKPNQYQHGLQVMPKKLTSSFLQYRIKQHSLIREQNNSNNTPYISKVIGEQWVKLEAEERAPFEKLSAEDKLRRECQLGELHQLGFYTLKDGSKSTDTINLPVIKKRAAK